MYDTEESPLSTMQAPRFTSGTREGWLCFRNEPMQSSTVNPKGGDCLLLAETSNRAGASPNSSADQHERGTGRMLS